MSAEDAILINPGIENPREHIEFHEEIPVGKTTRGKATITALGLDSLAQGECRREYLDQLRDLIICIELHSKDPRPEVISTVNKARQALSRAAADDAQFSAMAADYFAKHPIPSL